MAPTGTGKQNGLPVYFCNKNRNMQLILVLVSYRLNDTIGFFNYCSCFPKSLNTSCPLPCARSSQTSVQRCSLLSRISTWKSNRKCDVHIDCRIGLDQTESHDLHNGTRLLCLYIYINLVGYPSPRHQPPSLRAS